MVGTAGDRLLSEFGVRLGLPELAFDDNLSLLAFDGMEVEIEHRPNQRIFFISAELAQLSRQMPAVVLGRLMELNFVSVMVGVGAIALDPSNGTLSLAARFPIARATVDDLSDFIKDFIDQLEGLKALLARPAFLSADSTVTVPAPGRDDDLGILGMIRV